MGWFLFRILISFGILILTPVVVETMNFSDWTKFWIIAFVSGGTILWLVVGNSIFLHF